MLELSARVELILFVEGYKGCTHLYPVILCRRCNLHLEFHTVYLVVLYTKWITLYIINYAIRMAMCCVSLYQVYVYHRLDRPSVSKYSHYDVQLEMKVPNNAFPRTYSSSSSLHELMGIRVVSSLQCYE